MKKDFIDICIEGIEMRIAVLHQEGTQTPLIFLHGFGSTKEDYADIARKPEFKERTIIAYDAPGFGETECSDLSKVSIPFLVKTAEAVLKYYNVDNFHLAGHSMGGLTALMLLNTGAINAKSFIDIEGNVSPEDCFLSRQINEYPNEDPDVFLKEFTERMRNLGGYSNPLYAANLKSKVASRVVKPIFKSMVELSDHGNLMDKFLNLNCAKTFIYGEENRSLSYLPYLEKNGVLLNEISDSSHFPMYSNPPELWNAIYDFIKQEEVRF